MTKIRVTEIRVSEIRVSEIRVTEKEFPQITASSMELFFDIVCFCVVMQRWQGYESLVEFSR